MFALRHVTLFDHGGALVWEETEGHEGSPERDMLVTSQLRATAALQIRLPRKPLPPQTTSFFFAAVEDMTDSRGANGCLYGHHRIEILFND